MNLTASILHLARHSLALTSAALMFLTLYMVFLWAPTELNQGMIQRVFYFHVPLAWLGLLSIIIVGVASLAHLITGKEGWDSFAYTTAELGIIFATLVIVTGAIWGKPVWGVWWSWDPKLTTTLILWFIFIGYLMVRSYGPEGSQSKRFAAVVALLGALDAPIIYLASYWWRSAHPGINIGPLAEENSLDSRMAITFMVSLIAFTVLYCYMLMERYSLRKVETSLDEIHQVLALQK